MNIEVFKFGGASIKDANSIRNISNILADYKDQNTVVVMSALGKSTNQLEVILNYFFNKEVKEAFSALDTFRNHHYDIAKELMDGPILDQCINDLNDCFVEIEWILEDEIHDEYNYLYDQIVSVGELASTKLVNAFFNYQGHASIWFDVRNIIKTDNYHREANIIWDKTTDKTNQEIPKLFANNKIVLTQGFIGTTSDNSTTTLGREGSDYTAAIISYALNVKLVTIWKDVEGILTGDPRKINDAKLIPSLSFREAIEMTYYGAKVIHPKTIQPLQNKSIPLRVRSFIDKESEGTTIDVASNIEYPAITVIEDNQILIDITTRDFSFITEDHMTTIFNLISSHRIKVRLMRNSAVSFVMCIQDKHGRFDNFYEKISQKFNCSFTKGLELLTVRHYNPKILEERIAQRKIVFSEKYKDTIQLVLE